MHVERARQESRQLKKDSAFFTQLETADKVELAVGSGAPGTFAWGFYAWLPICCH